MKQNENSKVQVVLFVEGDTDEVLFRALIDYYKSISKTELNPCRICNLRGVTRYTSKLIAKLQNEYLQMHVRTDTRYRPCAAHTIQTSLRSETR